MRTSELPLGGLARSPRHWRRRLRLLTDCCSPPACLPHPHIRDFTRPPSRRHCRIAALSWVLEKLCHLQTTVQSINPSALVNPPAAASLKQPERPPPHIAGVLAADITRSRQPAQPAARPSLPLLLLGQRTSLSLSPSPSCVAAFHHHLHRAADKGKELP